MVVFTEWNAWIIHSGCVEEAQPTLKNREAGVEHSAPQSSRGQSVHLMGKNVFSGKMQIANGWEIRPFAVQIAEGTYSPGLFAREHRAGNSARKVIALESKCQSKEEAFEIAMAQSHRLECGA